MGMQAREFRAQGRTAVRRSIRAWLYVRIDIDRDVKLAGSRSYCWVGYGAFRVRPRDEIQAVDSGRCANAVCIRQEPPPVRVLAAAVTGLLTNR